MDVIARVIIAQAKKELLRLNRFIASVLRRVNSPIGTLFAWSRINQFIKSLSEKSVGCSLIYLIKNRRQTAKLNLRSGCNQIFES